MTIFKIAFLFLSLGYCTIYDRSNILIINNAYVITVETFLSPIPPPSSTPSPTRLYPSGIPTYRYT